VQLPAGSKININQDGGGSASDTHAVFACSPQLAT